MRQLLDSYLEANKKSIDRKPIFEFNNIFSAKLFDEGIDFDKMLCDEVKSFCKQNGFNIDKIVVISFMSNDLKDPESSLQMSSDYRLKVVEREDGKLEGVVLLGSAVKIK